MRFTALSKVSLWLIILNCALTIAQDEREISDPEEANSAIRTLVLIQQRTVSDIETWQGDIEFTRHVHSFKEYDKPCLMKFKIDSASRLKYVEMSNDLTIPSQKMLETPELDFSVIAGQQVMVIRPASRGNLINGRAYVTFKHDPSWLFVPEDLSAASLISKLDEFPFDIDIGKTRPIRSRGQIYQSGSLLRISFSTQDGDIRETQDWVFDLEQGGLPISFSSDERRLKALATHTYEKVNGCFVPKQITYKETVPLTGNVKFDLTFTFSNTKVNEKIDSTAFDPKKNGMLEGVSSIQDMRNMRMGPAK